MWIVDIFMPPAGKLEEAELASAVGSKKEIFMDYGMVEWWGEKMSAVGDVDETTSAAGSDTMAESGWDGYFSELGIVDSIFIFLTNKLENELGNGLSLFCLKANYSKIFFYSLMKDKDCGM
jgi:hypothetical protein